MRTSLWTYSWISIVSQDKSPVTIADKNTEEIIRNRVSKDFPNHGIIGEEFGVEQYARETGLKNKDREGVKTLR